MKIPVILGEVGMKDEDWVALRHEAEILFTPGTSIKEQDLFPGRSQQI